MSGVEGVTVAGFILPGFIILVSFGLGLGLALGFGGGGGVASERARVCGVSSAPLIPGQIQHECASLTPVMDIHRTKIKWVQPANVHGCMEGLSRERVEASGGWRRAGGRAGGASPWVSASSNGWAHPPMVL